MMVLRRCRGKRRDKLLLSDDAADRDKYCANDGVLPGSKGALAHQRGMRSGKSSPDDCCLSCEAGKSPFA